MSIRGVKQLLGFVAVAVSLTACDAKPEPQANPALPDIEPTALSIPPVEATQAGLEVAATIEGSGGVIELTAPASELETLTPESITGIWNPTAQPATEIVAIPEPATAPSEEPLQPVVGDLKLGSQGQQLILTEAGWKVNLRIGSTKVDENTQESLYWTGSEWLQLYDWLTDRLHNDPNPVVCLCFSGELVADPNSRDEFIIKTFLYNLSVIPANNDLFLAQGFDTSSPEAFLASAVAGGFQMPGGLQFAKDFPSLPGTFAFTPDFTRKAFKADRAILVVRGPGDGTLEPFKYGVGDPRLEMERLASINYNAAGFLTVGSDILNIGGDDIPVVFFNAEGPWEQGMNDSGVLRGDPDTRGTAADVVNDALYYYGILAPAFIFETDPNGPYARDVDDGARNGFWNTESSRQGPGVGIGLDFDQDSPVSVVHPAVDS